MLQYKIKIWNFLIFWWCYYNIMKPTLAELLDSQKFETTQGSNPGIRILYQLSHKGSPRILEWVAYPYSRGSSRPRNWTGVSCNAGGFFTIWAIREALWKAILFHKPWRNASRFFLKEHFCKSIRAWRMSVNDRRTLKWPRMKIWWEFIMAQLARKSGHLCDSHPPDNLLRHWAGALLCSKDRPWAEAKGMGPLGCATHPALRKQPASQKAGLLSSKGTVDHQLRGSSRRDVVPSLRMQRMLKSKTSLSLSLLLTHVRLLGPHGL